MGYAQGLVNWQVPPYFGQVGHREVQPLAQVIQLSTVGPLGRASCSIPWGNDCALLCF